jgi:hypothetical protein
MPLRGQTLMSGRPKVIYRQLVIRRIGWWIRVYLGGTSHPYRFRSWRSDLSRGVYLRLNAEQVVGIQWRRLRDGH